MTCLALGAKLGKPGSPPKRLSSKMVAKPLALRSWLRAAVPTPSAARPKSWRRVIKSSASRKGVIGLWSVVGGRGSVESQEFVGVHQGRAEDHPGGDLSGVLVANGGRVADLEQLFGGRRVGGVLGPIPGYGGEENLRFRGLGLAAEDQEVGATQARFVAFRRFEQPLGHRPARLEEGGLVHGGQRLERGVSPAPADDARFPHRSIEGEHYRRRACALPEEIEAAAVDGVAVVALVLGGVADVEANRLPKTIGLVRLEAVATDIVEQQPAGFEGSVADDFGVQPVARAARDEPVFGIGGQLGGSFAGALAERGGGDEQPVELLRSEERRVG